MEQRQSQVGEKLIGFLVVALSAFFLYHATKISGIIPDLTSPGAFPMMVTITMFVLSIIVLFENSKLTSQKYGSLSSYLKDLTQVVFTKDVLIITILLLLYSAFLSSVGFNITTVLFLWIGISYLTAGNLIRNLIIAVINLGIILFIFNFIFKVILP